MPSLSVVTGTILDVATGYPLAGLRVVAARAGAASSARKGRDSLTDKDARRAVGTSFWYSSAW